MCSDVVASIQGVSKQYSRYGSPWQQLWGVLRGRHESKGSFHAVEDVSFTLKPGETLGIIGRNGAGKSTLLQMLCGVLVPTRGRVQLNGRIAALLELGAGFNPEFTGRENVYLSAALYGLGHAEVTSRIESILAFAEIGEFIDQPVKTYSSGMFVRLAFAVIAHVDAQILVIDEALAVGDFAFTQKCMRFLESFAAKGTLIFVSHDIHSVIKLCHKALWLDAGRVRAYGAARGVCDEYLASFYEETSSVSDETKDTASDDQEFKREFGLGGGRIQLVEMLGEDQQPLRLLERPQHVCLRVRGLAIRDIAAPLIGFYIKDRFGQPIMGENTLRLVEGWAPIAGGMTFTVDFHFYLPLLATGEYSFTVALAEGSQAEHVQHHWIHDALVFKSSAPSYLAGFFQMENVSCDIRLQ